MEKFKFPLIDQDGITVSDEGLWGTLGFSEKYQGELSDTDELVIALQNAASNKELTSQEQSLLRSFSIAWLTRKAKNLGKVAAFGVELPKSVSYISQVGFLDKTASTIVSTSIKVAVCAIYLDLTWDLLTTDLSSLTSTEVAALAVQSTSAEMVLLSIPQPVLKQIEDSFGCAATPVKRLNFSSEPILSMLRLCKIRSMIHRFGFNKASQLHVTALLDQRIFALFLANSRQIEGLCLSGKPEASAAVAAHAAIALGIHDLEIRETLLQNWHQNIGLLDSAALQKEATTTLESIRSNLNNDFATIDRQLNRQLASASTTEAVALMAVPVEVSFQLMSLVAGSMERLSPDGHFKILFGTLAGGFNTAQQAAASTPGALAMAIDSGFSAEAWARKRVSELWPFG